MAKSFTHLHVHTEYSMLDGASRIGDVVAAAAADGQPAIGITDHGNMYGILPMYQAARSRGSSRSSGPSCTRRSNTGPSDRCGAGVRSTTPVVRSKVAARPTTT